MKISINHRYLKIKRINFFPILMILVFGIIVPYGLLTEGDYSHQDYSEDPSTF